MVGPVCAMIVPTATNVWYGNTPWPEGPPGLFQTFFNDGVVFTECFVIEKWCRIFAFKNLFNFSWCVVSLDKVNHNAAK